MKNWISVFGAKKDDLARDLIRRKLEAENNRTNAEKQLATIDNSIEKLQQRISDHHQQLDNMKQKLDLLVDENNPASVQIPTNSIRNEDIEIAFLREKKKRAVS